MVVVTVVENVWEIARDRFINKDTFKEIVYRTLMNNNDYRYEDCKIILPKNVTIAERHKLHILTCSGFFPRSKGDNENRIMELFITPEFFDELHQKYKIVKNVQEPIDPIIVMKKAILDDIMGIVEKHFNELFLKYYI